MEEIRTKNIRVLLLSRVEKQRKKLLALMCFYEKAVNEEEKELLHYLSSLYLLQQPPQRETYEKDTKQHLKHLEKGKQTVKDFHAEGEEALRAMEKKIRDEKPSAIESSQEIFFPQTENLISSKNFAVETALNLLFSGILEMINHQRSEIIKEEKRRETDQLLQKMDALSQFTLRKLDEIKSPDAFSCQMSEATDASDAQKALHPAPEMGRLLLSSSFFIYLPFSFFAIFDLFTACHLKVLIGYIQVLKSQKAEWILSILLGSPFHSSVLFLYILCSMLANRRYTGSQPLLQTISLFFLQGILSTGIFFLSYFCTRKLVVLGFSYRYHEYFLFSAYFLSGLIMYICKSIYKKSTRDLEKFPRYLFTLTYLLAHLSIVYLGALGCSTLFSIIRVYGLKYSESSIIPLAGDIFSKVIFS